MGKQTRINSQVKWLIVLFTMCLFAAGFFVLFSYNSEKQKLMSEASDALIRDSQEKSQEITDYLSLMESNLRTLQESPEVKESLKSKLFFNTSAIDFDVKEKANIVAREFENYIRAHPNMTLADLQKSDELKAIILRPVGKDGYTAIDDYENQIIRLSIIPRMINYNLSGFKGEGLQEIYNLQKEAQYKPDVSGFYDWREADGTMRRKYAHFVHVGIKTADGVGLRVISNAYVDDYKIFNITSENDSKYLEDFNTNSGYYNLFLISPSGYVGYVAKQESLLGNNLEWPANLDLGRSKNYFEVKKTNNLSFYGPFIARYEDFYPKISAITPVYENGTLLGYVGLAANMDKIFGITEKNSGAYDTEESYLVNSDKLLISPLKNRDLDIMAQSVETENSDECFGDLTELEKNGISAATHEFAQKQTIHEFLNYRGDMVLGREFPFPKTKWCLFSEVAYDDAVNAPLNDFITKKAIFAGVSVIIFSILVFFVADYLNKRKNCRKPKGCTFRVGGKCSYWRCALSKAGCNISLEKRRGVFEYLVLFLMITVFVSLDACRIFVNINTEPFMIVLMLMGINQLSLFIWNSISVWKFISKKLFFGTLIFLTGICLEIVLNTLFGISFGFWSRVLLFGTTFLYYFFIIKFLIDTMGKK